MHKSDAPNHVIWDILRAWCKEHPPKVSSKKKKNKRRKIAAAAAASDEAEKDETTVNGNDESNNEMTVSQKILAVEPKIQVDFHVTKPEGFGKKKRAACFPMNPAANWGPKPRAVGYKRKQEDE